MIAIIDQVIDEGESDIRKLEAERPTVTKAAPPTEGQRGRECPLIDPASL
jgi:hypothetical protein